MKKLIHWFDKRFLGWAVLCLLVFIPLYPKLPLIDIVHTWVYIRVEDFAIALVALLFGIQFIRRKVAVQSPLSIPIVMYWIVGGISLIHAILFLAPQMPQFFPHLGLLHYVRRIEYMILFFIAMGSIRAAADVRKYLVAFLVMLSIVILYGYGQKYAGFPAFLTMNEEFAKGVPLQLASDSRISSTFAGHYDLAAFLAFSLAFLTNLFFGIKNKWVKLVLVLLFVNASVILLFTASRISFVVYLLIVPFILWWWGKGKWIVPLVVLSFVAMIFASGTSERFGKTFRIEPVVYDLKTGNPIAIYKDFQNLPTPTPASNAASPASNSALLIVAPMSPISTPIPTPYENLPLGSGYLNMPFARKELITAYGVDYLVKDVVVYDISFTTRFQGQWPKAIEAFRRNIFFGSGYSSLSLAADNDYLRMLGETGLLGFASFMSILVLFFFMVRRFIRISSDPLMNAFATGVASGVLAIAINATLIDIFEASKVAYVLWIMIGITAGLYATSVSPKENLFHDVADFLRRPIIAIFALSATGVWLFADRIGQYFTGDDFTWLRWAFVSQVSDIPTFFLDANGFFYRPLTRMLTLFFYTFMGMSAESYHVVSIGVHIVSAILVYLIARRLIRRTSFAFVAAVIFLIHPIHAEVVMWMSGYSGLFAWFFYLLSLYCFMIAYGSKKWWPAICVWIISITSAALSIFFYELAISLPVAIIWYAWVYRQSSVKQSWKSIVLASLPYVLVAIVYVILRTNASAHFLSGDYSYRFMYVPFNSVGNSIGYLGELVTGGRFIASYDSLRLFFQHNRVVGALILLMVVGAIYGLHQKLWHFLRQLSNETVFSIGFFFIALLPVLGLGNIAERYAYMPSVAFAIIVSLVIRYIVRSLHAASKPRIMTSGVWIIVLLLCWYYWRQMRAAQENWILAGKTSYEIVHTITDLHPKLPSNTSLYLVSLPLRIDRAWVFPVGVDDALWLSYKDSTMRVFKSNTMDVAVTYKQSNPSTLIFLFQDGQLTEVTNKVVQ